MINKKFDLVVIGDGPAGSTAALQLKKMGYSVALVGQPMTNKKFFGETLPPGIQNSLIQLGLWKDFQNDGHLPATGNLSAWGDTEISETNFIFHPDMYGWHIDRKRFDLMIIKAAIRQGVQYLNNRLVEIKMNDQGTWHLKTRSYINPTMSVMNADFLIDATGRRGWLANFLNIKRLEFDNLIGFVSFLRLTKGEENDTMTLLEAVSDGWWYSALLPNKIRVVSFFTNRNLAVAKQAIVYKGWVTLILRTRHIKNILKKHKYSLIYGPYGRISSSSILQRFVGHRWLAVGDASLTFDPVSSNGISTAINNSMAAANLIANFLATTDTSFDSYKNKLVSDFYKYILKRNYYYNLEKRWLDKPFWKQNQKLDKEDLIQQLSSIVNAL
jgi:flavin-dependent dehydrogenase